MTLYIHIGNNNIIRSDLLKKYFWIWIASLLVELVVFASDIRVLYDIIDIIFIITLIVVTLVAGVTAIFAFKNK